MLGTLQVADGELSAGTLVAFLSTALALRWPVESIGFLLAMSNEAATATDRYFEVMDEPARARTGTDADPDGRPGRDAPGTGASGRGRIGRGAHRPRENRSRVNRSRGNRPLKEPAAKWTDRACAGHRRASRRATDGRAWSSRASSSAIPTPAGLPAHPQDVDSAHPARRDDGAGRRDGQREDHPDRAGAAAVRPDRGPDHPRRAGSGDAGPGRGPCAGRGGLRGADAVLGDRRRRTC